jgi:hypothetical protein
VPECDETNNIHHILSPGLFRRGDPNNDSKVDISDALFTLYYLFAEGKPLNCRDAADANDDGLIDISDPIHILTFLFIGGSPIPSPFRDCGSDPTSDDLDCGPCSCPPGPDGYPEGHRCRS